MTKQPGRWRRAAGPRDDDRRGVERAFWAPRPSTGSGRPELVEGRNGAAKRGARVPAIILVPAAILVAAFALAIYPRLTAARDAREQRTVLTAKAAVLEERVRVERPSTRPIDKSLREEFAQRTPAADPVPEVLSDLARLARGVGVQGLALEAGIRVDPRQPGVRAGADAESLDPRLDLFEMPIAYTPVTMRFTSTYAGLGRVLWNLRALPTTFEIRSLEVNPATNQSLIQIRLVLFAFQRVVPPRDRGQVSG